MSPTFKIAIGVFFGVIAAFLAVNAPGWIQQSRREGWYAEARESVRGLTPDLLIQRCGKPQKDISDKQINTRFMYYGNQHVVLTFWQTETAGPWNFGPMQFGGEIHVANKTAYADGKIITDAFEQVALLPCLEGKGAR